jgi:hypothetical protein
VRTRRDSGEDTGETDSCESAGGECDHALLHEMLPEKPCERN